MESSMANERALFSRREVSGLLLSAAFVLRSRTVFGSVGDGVTNDGVAFQQALDRSTTVQLPPGRYRIDGHSLRIRAGTRISGVAGKSILLKRTTQRPAYLSPFVVVEDASGVSINGISFAE